MLSNLSNHTKSDISNHKILYFPGDKQPCYTGYMSILDNLEAHIDFSQIDNAWRCGFEDSDLELQIQNPHISD